MPESPAEIVVKSAAEQRVEAAHGGRDIAAILRDLYVDQRMSQAAIAALLGVRRPTVVAWMRRHEIPTGYNRS